jgi:hypothetical protein
MINHHPLIGKGVGQINRAHKKIGDAEEKQIMVFLDLPGIPGNDKNSTGDDYAENFSQAVEKKKIVIGAEVEPDHHYGEANNIFLRERKPFFHESG